MNCPRRAAAPTQGIAIKTTLQAPEKTKAEKSDDEEVQVSRRLLNNVVCEFFGGIYNVTAAADVIEFIFGAR